MCGRHGTIVQATFSDHMTRNQTNFEAPISTTDSSLSASREEDSTNQNPHVNPDRHHGWHTEFCGFTSNWHRPNRATDYVVRTSFIRKAAKNRQSEGSRVNLILRFRSLLSRRGNGHHHHHHPLQHPQSSHKNTHLLNLPNTENQKLLEPLCASTSSGNCEHADESCVSPSLRRANSDSCLCRPQNHSHATLLRLPCSFMHSSTSPDSATSPVSDSTAETGSLSLSAEKVEPSHEHPKVTIRRRSSLSTGNICCLYALRCLPSVEYLNTPLGRASPAMRRRSLPVSSLKSDTQSNGLFHHTNGKFSLNSLRQHPCYQNVQRNLNQWVKRTLDIHSSNDSGLNEADVEGGGGGITSSRACSQDSTEWIRHVRFADEATGSSSATTLNSLSASSSARSLTSLVMTPFNSPYDSILNLEPATSATTSVEHGSNQPGSSLKQTSLHPLSRKWLKKFAQLNASRPLPMSPGVLSMSKTIISPTSKSSKPERGDKMTSLSRRIWRRRNKRSKDKRNTPLVTVNVIHDYSEPPYIPTHVLKELQVEEEQPFWRSMFANPDESPQFHQNLFKQHIHLGRIWSLNLNSINVDVYVVVAPPCDNEPSPQIRLRYTLDNWRTYHDSEMLVKMHTTKIMLSPCDVFWAEIHSSRVQLKLDGFRDGGEPDRLEFAVVARRNGSEWWDNNGRQNYVCRNQKPDLF